MIAAIATAIPTIMEVALFLIPVHWADGLQRAHSGCIFCVRARTGGSHHRAVLGVHPHPVPHWVTGWSLYGIRTLMRHAVAACRGSSAIRSDRSYSSRLSDKPVYEVVRQSVAGQH